MADIQSTLDLIDGALGDHLSADAMRWTPDETERAESNPEPATGGYLTPGVFQRAVHRMLAESPGLDRIVQLPPNTFQIPPDTRVWLNGEEITDQISGVTVERAVGQRTRIGFNGGDPVVRNNVRVEVRHGENLYVIDETHQWDEQPLRRLSDGPLRGPLSDRDWRGYWPEAAADDV